MTNSSYLLRALTIRYFRTSNGRAPVLEYIAELPADRSEAITAALEDLEHHGLEGSIVTCRHIESKLWELKFPEDRVFYVVITGPEMVLLHAYRKQGQKAPLKELATARSRLKRLVNT
jgi:phage-related protein